MNEQELSKRLHKVGEYVVGGVVADIGTDHGYLPVYLVKNGKCEKAIAGEVNEGPLSSAKSLIAKHELSHKIEARLASGLQVLEARKADTVVIAGMGGPLIASILDEGKNELREVSRLVLQPNVAADHIRKWLLHNNWGIVTEAIIEEDSHIYEVIVAEPGKPKAMYSKDIEKELWMGPYLLKNKNSAFQKKWEREKLQLENIDAQLKKANEDNIKLERLADIRKKLNWLKEELI